MTKVAILGGGPAGIAAAYELSDPALEGAYEVTVYQPGWRLGGKCASGRNVEHHSRIEEHGLHVWFGFYDNAFDLIQRCYTDLGRSWEEAFTPCHDVVLLDEHKGTWTPRTWRFPANDGVPGIARDRSVGDVGERLFQWLHHTMADAESGKLPPGTKPAIGVLRKIFDEVVRDDDKPGLSLDDVLTKVLHVSSPLRGRLWGAGEALHQYAMAFDLMITVLRGIQQDKLLTEGFGSINHIELSDWLIKHGLEPETRDSPLLTAFYQLCFAYRDGDRNAKTLAAGKALQAILRMAFTYEGAVMWKMRDGMGDAIFSPLYRVLSGRGVRFEFFHHVTHLGVEDGRIERVELSRQASLNHAGEYRPLLKDPADCWPSEPDWDQLRDGAALRDQGVNFEHDPSPPGAQPCTLTCADGDFDEVVLAIPVGALEPICGELAAANPHFRTMLDARCTVATQALQVWLSANAAALGWQHGRATICGSYAEPLDTYCDMSHLIRAERWPAGEIGHIAYFCGVMDETALAPSADPQKIARRDGEQHLAENMPTLWPGLRPGMICDRFTRANSAGSERYVLTPPGSVTARLRPDESGFGNVKLAGDWTRNGICGGSVEAAITSGRMAARAISGRPAEIPGLTGWLVDD